MNIKYILSFFALLSWGLSTELSAQCTVEINAPTVKCNGETEQLTVTYTGQPALSYAWSASGNGEVSFDDAAAVSPTITYTKAGNITISVTVTTTNPALPTTSCTDDVVFFIGASGFYEIDQQAANNDFDYTLCKGLSVALDAQPVGNGSAANFDFAWSQSSTDGGAVTFSNPMGEDTQITTDAAGTVDVTLTYTDGTGCVDVFTRTFTIYEDVSAVISNGTSADVCNSETYQLFGTATGGGDNYTHEWQLVSSTDLTLGTSDVLNDPNGQNPTFSAPAGANDGDTYVFTYTATPTDDDCSSDESAQFTITNQENDESATLQTDNNFVCTPNATKNLSVRIVEEDRQAPLADIISSSTYDIVISRSNGNDITLSGYTSGDNIPVTISEEETFTLVSAIDQFDCSPNTVTGSLTIIIDMTAPVILDCPGDQTIDGSASDCSVTVPDYKGDISVEDDCTFTIEQNPTAGSTIPNPRHGVEQPVVLTVTDANNNVSTCEFKITINDDTDPTITTCPPSRNINMEEDMCAGLVPNMLSEFIVDDNCGVMTVSQSPDAGTSFGNSAGDQQTITFTVTDFNNQSTTCTAQLTLVDNQDPVFTTLPETIEVNPRTDIFGNPNCVGVVPDMEDFVVATDNCDDLTYSQNPANGVVFDDPCHGSFEDVVVTVSDGTNEIMGTVRVIFVDNVVPTIDCSGLNETATANPVSCGANVTVGMPTAEDNCENNDCMNTLSITHNSPFGASNTDASGPYPAGVTTITWTVTDAGGNTATCTSTVTVEDTVAPEFTCSNIDTNTDNGVCSATFTDMNTDVDDACGNIASITYELTGATTGSGNGLLDGVTLNEGRTTVTYTATDDVNNSGSCSFIIDVKDNVAPVIMISPTERDFSTDANNCEGSVPDLVSEATVNDNCTATGDIVVTQNPAVGTTFTDEQEVTITAIDDEGNAAMTVVTLTLVDDVLPTITCPSDISQDNDTDACMAMVTVPMPTTDDNCGVLSVTNDYNDGGADASDMYPVGTTTVTFTVTDLSMNTQTCSMMVEVNDNTPPTISCSADIPLTTDSEQCVATFTDVTTTFSDNCETLTVSYSYSNGGLMGQTRTGNGTGLATDVVLDYFENPTIATTPNVYTFTYTFNDGNGNIMTCNFDVTVDDQTGPVITGPADVEVAAGTNCEGTVPDLVNSGNYSAVDNCGGASNISQDPASGTTFSGSQTVILTSTDDSGNNGTLAVNVFATDTQDPVITCPTGVASSYNVDANACMATVNLNPASATDNCGATITNDYNDGGADASGMYPVGTTTVVFTATDAAGQSVTCDIDIVVVDNQDPVITNCPASQAVEPSNGNCTMGIVPDLAADVMATDNCPDNVVISQSPLAGTSFTNSQVVTFSVTDGTNTVTCTANITILDDEDPVFTDCENAVLTAMPNSNSIKDASCQVMVPDFSTVVTATDNCGTPTLSQSPMAGTMVDASSGDVAVTVTATDVANNTATCVATLKVEETTKPFLRSIPMNMQVASQGIATTVSWAVPEAYDFCDNNLSVSVSANNGVTITNNGGMDSGDFPNGTTRVTYIAIDANGNTETGRFDVIVE